MAVDFGCQQNMISSIPGDNISRKAFGALRGHAGLFMECGMLDQQEHSGVISLQNHKTSLDLLFHVRRKLLSRVYHLRIVSRMVPKNGHGSDDHYRLGLKVSGIRRFKHRFSIHGKGHVAGKALADQLILSGLIQQLTENVTIEHLSISWNPESCQWLVSVGPYPGSYVYLIFPPMKQNVKLRKTEANALYDFIEGLGDFLNAGHCFFLNELI